MGLLLAEVLTGVWLVGVVGVLCRGSRCIGSLVDVVVMDDCEGWRLGAERLVLAFLAGVPRECRLGGALEGSVYPNCRGGKEARGTALKEGGTLAVALGLSQPL